MTFEWPIALLALALVPLLAGLLWLSRRRRSRYAIRVVRDSTTILGRYPKQTSFQFSSSWSWDGQRRSLQRGADYYVYVYAYTKGFPNGRWIGQTHFRIR